jgi:hypothetical protein
MLSAMNLLVFLKLSLYPEFPECSLYKSHALWSVVIKVLFHVVTLDLLACHNVAYSDPSR